MQLVVAEKPSVARDLARVLGVATQGKQWFEGRDRIITWCIGHLVELEEPAAYDGRWKAWRLDTLPMLPAEFRLRGSKHALPQLKAVARLLKERGITSVVNACDAGREGELIFRYVYQYAGARLPVQRLWISSLTDDAIRRGFASLRPGRELDALADAARSRSEADWLVGMNATRAVTVRGRDAGHTALFSIGRVQTPTLAMLVERERAIAAFVPQDYWEVRADLATAGGERFVAQWRHGKASRLGTAALADAVVARARACDAAVVERVEQKLVREPPPLLFDLTSLQRTAHRRFGFSAARTLELAQALYERHKVLTYPRTDSRYLTSDNVAELPAVLDGLSARPEYAPFVAELRARPASVQHPGRRIVDDAKVHDHHAIIPTAKRSTESLGPDERKLFDLVARRFLGAFFPDAELAATEVWVRAGAVESIAVPANAVEPTTILAVLPPPPDRFVARGRVRLVAGWQAVAGIDARTATRDRDDRDEAPTLPRLVEGDVLAGAFASRAKQTTPPPRFSEATLLAAMESAGKAMDDEELRAAMRDTGLGTPATRASIIETLLQRAYIMRVAKELVPTPTGMGLIAALPVADLGSAELTGRWEARLARIARGEESRAAFMADIARYVEAIIAAIRGGLGGAAPPPSTPAPPPSGSGPTARARSKWSRPTAARAKASRPRREARAAGASAVSEVGDLACPRCSRGRLIAGSRGWGCSRWREGCAFVIWFETAGRRLSAAQLRDLITRGKTRQARFEPTGGNVIEGRLRLDPARDGGAASFEPAGAKRRERGATRR